MRRTLLSHARAFRRSIPRKTVRGRVSGSNDASHQRFIGSRGSIRPHPLHTRRVSNAVLATVAAGSAWLAYRSVPGIHSPLHLDASTPKAVGPQAEQLSEVARKALILERDQLYTSEIPQGQRLSKTQEGRKVLEMMTEDQVTTKLRENEESFNVGRGRGVVRYDVVQLASNNPIEDDHAEKIVEVPLAVPGQESTSSDWMFWGVFDGHSGWTTSAKLRQALISFVARELNSTYTAATTASILSPSPTAVDEAIRQGFLRLDNHIVNESVQKVLAAKSRPLASELLAPALSGAVAILSFYDSRSKELRVACTGDSRAVLGRRSENGKWTAIPLSTDFTGGTASEIARIQAEHPNEPYAVINGRVLGALEPSRAFGDAAFKWSLETQAELRKKFFTSSTRKYCQTPPYVTAEPIITTTKIRPEKNDFVVMATDGLWEMLTNDEVIGLVGMWLEKHGTPAQKSASSTSWLPSFLGGSKPGLPINPEASHSEHESGQRAPIRQQQWGVSANTSDRFVVEDKNVATHLVRNALGGKDRDMVSALLTLPSPYSRKYRDDLTVEVIFFGEGEITGKVEANTEATASTGNVLKAKL